MVHNPPTALKLKLRAASLEHHQLTFLSTAECPKDPNQLAQCLPSSRSSQLKALTVLQHNPLLSTAIHRCTEDLLALVAMAVGNQHQMLNGVPLLPKTSATGSVVTKDRSTTLAHECGCCVLRWWDLNSGSASFLHLVSSTLVDILAAARPFSMKLA